MRPEMRGSVCRWSGSGAKGYACVINPETKSREISKSGARNPLQIRGDLRGNANRKASRRQNVRGHRNAIFARRIVSHLFGSYLGYKDEIRWENQPRVRIGGGGRAGADSFCPDRSEATAYHGSRLTNQRVVYRICQRHHPHTAYRISAPDAQRRGPPAPRIDYLTALFY